MSFSDNSTSDLSVTIAESQAHTKKFTNIDYKKTHEQVFIIKLGSLVALVPMVTLHSTSQDHLWCHEQG